MSDITPIDVMRSISLAAIVFYVAARVYDWRQRRASKRRADRFRNDGFEPLGDL